MNLSPAWVQSLKEAGHDAIHWRDVGSVDASDDEILAWSARDERTILTADLDFGAAVATRRLASPAIVQLRTASTDPHDIASLVIKTLAAVGERLTGGAILTIENDNIRLRPAPQQLSSADDDHG